MGARERYVDGRGAASVTSVDWILEEMTRAERGLSPHYLLLYAVVRGMEAQRVLEIGAGLSTRVLLQALQETGGRLESVSTESAATVRANFLPGDLGAEGWWHTAGLTMDVLPRLAGIEAWAPGGARRAIGPFEVILHDGAHNAATVEADLRLVLPLLRRFGLCLVHDTQHAVHGPGLAGAVARLRRDFDLSEVTLPYGFGLTMLRQESESAPPWEPKWRKVGSPHRTVPARVGRLISGSFRGPGAPAASQCWCLIAPGYVCPVHGPSRE